MVYKAEMRISVFAMINYCSRGLVKSDCLKPFQGSSLNFMIVFLVVLRGIYKKSPKITYIPLTQP